SVVQTFGSEVLFAEIDARKAVEEAKLTNAVHEIVADLEEKLIADTPSAPSAPAETVEKTRTETIAAPVDFEASAPIAKEPIAVFSGAQVELLQAAKRGGRLHPEPEIETALAEAAPAEPTVAAPVDEAAGDLRADVETKVQRALPASSWAQFAANMQKAASRGNRQTMASLMQDRFGLSLETCHQVFEDTTGDTLAVLLRSIDVDSAAANRILLLTFPAIGLSVHNAGRAIRYYASLSMETCKEAVAQWPKAVSGGQVAQTAVHQPYVSDADGGRRHFHASRSLSGGVQVQHQQTG
ncbi:MAG: hypothetical protein AAFO73_05715, partial [Pseudomonadota bacterium]